jgi:hypothetical protein
MNKLIYTFAIVTIGIYVFGRTMISGKYDSKKHMPF